MDEARARPIGEQTPADEPRPAVTPPPGEGARHSEHAFGDQRDFWWNADFLRLMARRWRLDDVETVLDVGCGVGHWGRVLSDVLPPAARLTGVDREPDWVAEAGRLAGAAGLGDRFAYLTSTAEDLPFADGRFDMVTCQTLLMHVAEPRDVLAEMLRVLRPGGLLVLGEPSIRAGELVESSASAALPLDDVIERIAFYLICERGRRELGEGYLSIGDLLPGILAEFPVDELRVYLADKTSVFVPPYASAEEQAWIAELHEAAERPDASVWWDWTAAEARRYWRAGGGDAARFDLQWGRRLDEDRRLVAAIDDGTFHCAGAAVFYLISARKRPA